MYNMLKNQWGCALKYALLFSVGFVVDFKNKKKSFMISKIQWFVLYIRTHDV